VGLVRSAHGLNGVVRVEVLTDHPELRFARGARVYAEGTSEPLTIVLGEPVPDGPGWRLRFREIPDRTAAETLSGTYLESEVEGRRAAPAEGEPVPEAWWDEVIGATVVGPDREELGTVTDVYRAGAAEVYSVAGGSRGDFELPAVRGCILEFAPREGRIVVDPLALDLPPARGRGRPRGRRTVRAARAETTAAGPSSADHGAA
jgi:16S rRNA processing protein RimM